MDLETEIAKISEAYCVANDIPIRRRFSDAELADTIALLADSAKLARQIEERARLEFGL